MISMFAHGSDVIVVVLIVIMLMMVVFVMFVLIMLVLAVMMLVVTVMLMVMLVVVLVCRDSRAGRLGSVRVAGLRARGLRSFAGGLLGSSVMVLRGNGIRLTVGMLARFVGCALPSFARGVPTLSLDRAFGEALRLAGSGRVGVRLIVLRVGVVVLRLVVGLVPFGRGREARLGGLDDLALDPFAAAAAP
nr:MULTISPECIES: hypothetical protein [unclassified Bradyrhizobium]